MLLACLPLTVFAQEDANIKKQINNIKKHPNQYIYADVTAATEQDAHDLAEDQLNENINEWAATKRKLRGSANLVISNKKELWTELKMPRGNMYRSFLYVKKADIQGVDNAQVVENTSAAPPAQVEHIVDVNLPSTVKELMSYTKYADFTTKLKQKKAEGKVISYARYASLDNPDIYYLAVYNRSGEIVAFLTPAPNRVNAATKKADDVSNYSGCGAIGFQVTDK